MASESHLADPPALQDLLDQTGVALFLDFDGTLVELAPGPDAIEPRSDLAQVLAVLDKRIDHRAAIVSGRGLSDIEKHIGKIPTAAAGSHGSDIRLRDGSMVGETPNGLTGELERELRRYAHANGVDYEHKPHGGALHYRSAPEKGDATEQFARSLAARHGWKAQSGKCVIELIKGDADKGTAVEALMTQPDFAGARPVFVGDDLTDEAGFAACNRLGGFGILVGERSPTVARYKLADVASVHSWLGL